MARKRQLTRKQAAHGLVRGWLKINDGRDAWALEQFLDAQLDKDQDEAIRQVLGNAAHFASDEAA